MERKKFSNNNFNVPTAFTFCFAKCITAVGSKLIVLLIIFFLSASPALAATYYVSPTGNDAAAGTQTTPWKTIQKAVEALQGGDTLLVREGTYETINNAWRFKNTGTAANPITIKNYPNEQAVFKINTTQMEYRAFRCEYNSTGPISWQTPQADYIKLLGSDVDTTRTLSNGVQSRKGLVVLGMFGANAIGIESMGSCNNWEVAGFDFVETGGGIFQRNGDGGNWSIHDNRVYNFYRESGMQFNQHNNQVVHNEIYLVNSLPRTYGCQMINLLGHGNVVRSNRLSREGSTYRCGGVLFEWDFGDNNIIEQNTMYNVTFGISIQGGDNNIIRNNVLYKTPGADVANDQEAIIIYSYDNKTDWPCDHIDSDCHSTGNQIFNNTIYNFSKGGILLYSVNGGVSTGTLIKNNLVANSNPAIECSVKYNNSCSSDSFGIAIDYNVSSGMFGFVNQSTYDFHLTSDSNLVNQGISLAQVTRDFDGIIRPQGSGFDIGAYEYTDASPSTPPSPTTSAGKAGDANGDNKVDGVDYVVWLTHFNQSVSGAANGDFNNNGKVDGVDYVVWVNNYGK